MEETLLKIKELRGIKTEKAWIKQTKRSIMGAPFKKELIRLPQGIFNRNWLIVPAALGFVFFGIFLYHQNVLNPQIASLDVEILENLSSGLRLVENDILRTTESLSRLGYPQKALEVEDMVNSALENGEKVVDVTKRMVDEPKTKNKDSQSLSAMASLESAADSLRGALENMEETYWQRQKELARDLIQELETQELSENQKALLEQAKSNYNNGMFAESLARSLEALELPKEKELD